MNPIPFLILSLSAGVLLSGCGKQSSTEPGATNSASPLTAPVDYLGAVGKAQQHAVKTIDTSSIQQAIQLFQVEEGRYPRDLTELVQKKYLARIPEAPHGMKIEYNAATGKVRVVPQ